MHLHLKRNKIFWHFVARARNGQVVLTSENYFSRGNALRAAKKAAAAMKVEIK